MEKTATKVSEANEAAEAVTNNKKLKKTPIQKAKQTLKYSTLFWFITVLVGQWFFFYYIIAFYGFSVINDNMEIWNRWEAMGSKPYHAGDFAGNFAFAAHAIGAGIVAIGGALQLVPQVRKYFPKFHKINGYVYILTVFALALSGFYLVWIRDQEPLTLSGVGTSLNGLLIFAFAYLTLRFAIKRDIATHRKWAMRLFLVSNAQWTLRVGVFSYFVTGTMLGLEPAFGDIFFPLWTFGCFLLPLAVLQAYFYANEKGGVKIKNITSAIMVTVTLLMIFGMIGFTPFLLTVMSGGKISV